MPNNLIELLNNYQYISAEAAIISNPPDVNTIDQALGILNRIVRDRLQLFSDMQLFPDIKLNCP